MSSNAPRGVLVHPVAYWVREGRYRYLEYRYLFGSVPLEKEPPKGNEPPPGGLGPS